MSIISGNMIGSYSQIGKTFTIVDENGAELIGVITDVEQVFNATPEDVKAGKVFAYDGGVGIGTDTRTYRTTHSTHLVSPGSAFSIPLEEYDAYNYTKFQAMIAEYNTNEANSTTVSKVVLNDCVYNVNDGTKVADVTKNHLNKSVDFNITNDTNKTYIIYYSTYKDE